jgi:tetratricopeptide (TPR) repeat protein
MLKSLLESMKKSSKKIKNGMDFFKEDRFNEAIAYYDEVLKNDPDNETALNNKACVLAYSGKFDESVKLFDTILSRDFSNSLALSNKATVLGKRGDYDAALLQFASVLKTSPHSLGTRISYINLLTFLGRYKEALACKRAMPRPPAMTYMLLGSLSDDFKMLDSLKGTIHDKIEKMKRHRDRKDYPIGANKRPDFVSLLFAPDP